MDERAPAHALDAPGVTCISLTPMINKTISGLPPGALLEVRTDDPAAREGIPAWCRLTKNPLIDVIEHDPKTTTFWIQTKEAASL